MKKIIEVDGVSKTFGKGTTLNKVLDNCSLYVNEGEFVSLMGASGSGKSTLLYLIGDPKGPSTSAPFAFMILNSDLISASWEFPFCPPFLPSFSAFPRFCLPFPSYILFSVAFFFSISVSVVEGESSLAFFK